MSARSVEEFLARIYVDAEARQRFLDDPEAEALRSGLNEEEARAFLQLDRNGLMMAAESYAKKRATTRTGTLRMASPKKLMQRMLDRINSRSDRSPWKHVK